MFMKCTNWWVISKSWFSVKRTWNLMATSNMKDIQLTYRNFYREWGVSHRTFQPRSSFQTFKVTLWTSHPLYVRNLDTCTSFKKVVTESRLTSLFFFLWADYQNIMHEKTKQTFADLVKFRLKKKSISLKKRRFSVG